MKFVLPDLVIHRIQADRNADDKLYTTTEAIKALTRKRKCIKVQHFEI